ncbi:MAG: hypothetical protein ACFFBP_12005 [Promethearchaeota archaeon]
MTEIDTKDGLNKKIIVIFLAIMVLVFIIGIITSFFRYFNGYNPGHDFYYFYNAVQKFWLTGENLYEDNIINLFQIEGYFYLNYFCIICFWMLLPFPISFSIHLIITFLMFYLILKNIRGIYQEWWIYGNIIMVFWWSMLFNTNIWIAFALFMYQKYRDKWYSPLFLFLAFYKITSIIAFGLLYLVNLIFEKKIRWNQVPALIGVVMIMGISYLTSTGINANNTLGSEMVLLLLQVPHYIWWSISILAFIEYKKYPIKHVKIFWIIFCVFEIILCLVFLPIIAFGIETFIS